MCRTPSQDALAFGHQGADLPLGVDDGGVVAALIILSPEPMTNVLKVYSEAEPSAAEVT